MLQSPSRAVALTLMAVVMVAGACREQSPSGPGDEPLPPMTAATWHAQSVSNVELPALVATRLLGGGVTETIYLDSAIVDVRADGRWVQQLYLQVFHSRAYVLSYVQRDSGSWVEGDTAYLFQSDSAGPRFSIRDPESATQQLGLRGFDIADVMPLTFTKTPRPATVHGRWRATTVHANALPAAIYVFDPYEEDGVEMSVHLVIDSVVLQLHANGGYNSRIAYTEWGGAVGGPPATVRSKWTVLDFGEWTKNGAAIAFASSWLEGHDFSGTVVGGSMQLMHGITHGDEPAVFTYSKN